MDRMRDRVPAIIGTLVLLSLGVSPARAANGVVSLTWDGCTGPMLKTSSGPGIYSIYVSVLGIDVPNKAYDVRVVYGDVNQLVPDAWRFDAAGCHTASALTIDQLPLLAESKTCPPFMQESAPSLQIKDVGFSPPSDPYPNSLMRLVLANSYPNGVSIVEPLTRYHLGRFVFDHALSVEGPGTPGSTCGGLESAMCFKLFKATFLDMNGIETPFNYPAIPAVTMNDLQQASCSAVPARPTTWGQLKNQYRN
jgi:hypothetical protein